MVILIGGASCTGKTVLAQRLLERYRIPYMSADHVKMGLVRGWKDCPFTPCDPNAQITAYLWPVLEEIARTNLENGQHLVVEGCYIPPERARALEVEYPGEVLALYLGFSREYVLKAYEGIIAHRSDVERRGYDEERTPEQIAQEHEAVRASCEACGARYMEIGDNYESGIARVIALTDAFMHPKDFAKKNEKSEKNA